MSTPNAIRLRFQPTRDDLDQRTLAVVAETLGQDPQVVVFGPLNYLKEWLGRHGYRYVPGTQAIWVN
jgi:hypothetical protein